MMSEWISVKDRLPEEECYCWIYNGADVFLADFNPDCICDDHIFPSLGFSVGEDDLEEVVTHWMECKPPQPPKEQAESD